MLIQWARNVYGHLHYILQCAANERPAAAARHVVVETIRVARDSLRAYLAGWPSSYLGAGSRIIGTKAIRVGPNARIKHAAWVEAIFSYNDQMFTPAIVIGKNLHSSDRLHISAIGHVQIGDDCLFGSGVYISDHNHGNYRGAQQSRPDEPPIARRLGAAGALSIGSNVWLGDNVVIVGSVKIGDGSIIGANSVVTRDLPANVIAVGAPAQILKVYCAASGEWKPYVTGAAQTR